MKPLFRTLLLACLLPAAALAELDRISRLVATVETAVARRRDVVANAAAATSTATAARV